MKTSSKALFMMMMLLSSIMVLNSSSWINMWMGLEINLMSFIPLISTSKNPFKSQSIMMYFLVQSMASMIFIINVLMEEYINMMTSMEMTKMMIIMSMMMKMGVPPFHMWFPEMMNKMSWSMCFLLMSWQKLAPMYIMSLVIDMSKPVMMMICGSALFGAIGGINQTSTRKIMAFSSINHLSWMIACTATYKKSWIMYLSLYTLLMMSVTSMMYNYNIMYINQMNMFSMMNMDKMIIMTMMLSMGGIPPFLGFIPKWISIQYLMPTNEILIMMIMIMSALITQAYYLRLSSHLNLMKTYSQKWMHYYKSKKSMMYFMFNMNMMLPLIILLMNFY